MPSAVRFQAACTVSSSPCWMRRVMVESFVATQKVSVQKSLMRTFSAKYIKQAADFDELLMSLLQAGPCHEPCHSSLEPESEPGMPITVQSLSTNRLSLLLNAMPNVMDCVQHIKDADVMTRMQCRACYARGSGMSKCVALWALAAPSRCLSGNNGHSNAEGTTHVTTLQSRVCPTPAGHCPSCHT